MLIYLAAKLNHYCELSKNKININQKLNHPLMLDCCLELLREFVREFRANGSIKIGNSAEEPL